MHIGKIGGKNGRIRTVEKYGVSEKAPNGKMIFSKKCLNTYAVITIIIGERKMLRPNQLLAVNGSRMVQNQNLLNQQKMNGMYVPGVLRNNGPSVLKPRSRF